MHNQNKTKQNKTKSQLKVKNLHPIQHLLQTNKNEQSLHDETVRETNEDLVAAVVNADTAALLVNIANADTFASFMIELWYFTMFIKWKFNWKWIVCKETKICFSIEITFHTKNDRGCLHVPPNESFLIQSCVIYITLRIYILLQRTFQWKF